MRAFWVRTSPQHLLDAQRKLLRHYVKTPLVERRVALASGEMVNLVDTCSEANPNKKTLVLTSGFGSGLGLWFANLDALMKQYNGQFERIVAVDWLGMGGSSRPHRSQLPLRIKKDSAKEFISFFVSSLEECLTVSGLKQFHLLGHSFGGYIGAQFAFKHPELVTKLILASPVGIPIPPRAQAVKRNEMPIGTRMLDSLWNCNFTPQTILRIMGPRGPQVCKSVIKGRFSNIAWSAEEIDIISDYFYHITCARASGEYALNAIMEPLIFPKTAGSTTRDARTGIYARLPLHTQLLDPNVLQTPTLLQYGDHDWMFHPQIPEVAQARKNKPGIYKHELELDIIPKAGHHLYLDNPTAFHHSINKFCE